MRIDYFTTGAIVEMKHGSGNLSKIFKYIKSDYLRYGTNRTSLFKIISDILIGYGLYIGHGIGIVINPTAKIGNNCNLSQFTTIGSNHNKTATIGDNVYIGPSVCIVEDVSIGDNVTIRAGSVVVKDISANATVAGVPEKVLNYNEPGRYTPYKWEE